MHTDRSQRKSNSPRTIAATIAALLLGAASLHAQTNPAAAPLPAAIINAHKLFLGNAGETDNDDCFRAYNDFYAGLKAEGHLQLVADPGDADLVLELHYEIRPGTITGPSSNVNTTFARQFRLILIDPHTHTILWSLTEAENNALLQSNRNKNLDAAVMLLLADFKALHAGTYSAPIPPGGKTRFSQQGNQ
jgi:hypothetical protein